MDKLTSILACADEGAGAPALLDKAVFLARCFNARLEIVSDDLSLIELLAARRAGQGYVEATLRGVAPGGGPAAVVREVGRCGADLLLRSRLAADNWVLAESTPVPLLLVGTAPWTAPLRIAAAVDVSEHATRLLARAILQATGFLALGSGADLDVYYCEREARDDATRLERAVRLAQLVREFHVGTEKLRLIDGAPEKVLAGELAATRHDILAIGAISQRSGFAAMFSGLSHRLVGASAGDVLLVPPAGEACARTRVTARSGASRAAAVHSD